MQVPIEAGTLRDCAAAIAQAVREVVEAIDGLDFTLSNEHQRRHELADRFIVLFVSMVPSQELGRVMKHDETLKQLMLSAYEMADMMIASDPRNRSHPPIQQGE